MTEHFFDSSDFQPYFTSAFSCMCVCVHLRMSERSMLDPWRCGALKSRSFHLYSAFPPAVLPSPDWLLIFFIDSIHLPSSESSWTDWLKQVN